MNKRICFYSRPFPEIKSYYDMINEACAFNLSAVEGFSMMEFAHPDIEAAKRVKEYADEKQVKFPCFSVYANVVGDDSKEMTERLKKYADVAKILGSPYLHHTIAAEFSDPSKVVPYKEEFFSKGISVIREICDYCESIGIKAIYEEQGFIFNGVKGIERLLSEVNRDIGLVADFANIYQSGEDIESYVKAYLPLFVHAHVKDIVLTEKNHTGKGLPTLSGKFMNEVPVGEGIVNIRGVISFLESNGYKGSYAIEYSAKEAGSDDIARAVHLIDSQLK